MYFQIIWIFDILYNTKISLLHFSNNLTLPMVRMISQIILVMWLVEVCDNSNFEAQKIRVSLRARAKRCCDWKLYLIILRTGVAGIVKESRK